MKQRNPKTTVDAYLAQQPREARNRELTAQRLDRKFTDHPGADGFKVPCLRCGNRVTTRHVSRPEGSFVYVRCKVCGPVSGNYATREEAVAAWNGRVPA